MNKWLIDCSLTSKVFQQYKLGIYQSWLKYDVIFGCVYYIVNTSQI